MTLQKPDLVYFELDQLAKNRHGNRPPDLQSFDSDRHLDNVLLTIRHRHPFSSVSLYCNESPDLI